VHEGVWITSPSSLSTIGFISCLERDLLLLRPRRGHKAADGVEHHPKRGVVLLFQLIKFAARVRPWPILRILIWFFKTCFSKLWAHRSVLEVHDIRGIASIYGYNKEIVKFTVINLAVARIRPQGRHN
jgi:hypothetical protein